MVTVKDRLVEILEEEPYIHLQIELADELGVSRERIRQLVIELHLRHLLGKRVGRPFISCSKCGKPTKSKEVREGQLCRKCYYKGLEKRKVTVICDWCGKKFKRPKSVFNATIARKYKHSFCSMRCLGKWLGTTYGFGVHKKTRRLRLTRKMEIEEIKRAEVPPKIAKRNYAILLDRCIHLEGNQALKVKCESLNHSASMRQTLKRHFARLGINCDVTSRTIGENYYMFVWKRD